MFLIIKSMPSLTEWQTWRRLDGSEASSRHKHASKGIPREGVFCKYQWENSNVNLSERSQQREVWERENRRGLWSDTHWLPGVTPLVWSKLNKKTHWLWIRADDLCKGNLLLCDAMKTTEYIKDWCNHYDITHWFVASNLTGAEDVLTQVCLSHDIMHTLLKSCLPCWMWYTLWLLWKCEIPSWSAVVPGGCYLLLGEISSNEDAAPNTSQELSW